MKELRSVIPTVTMHSCKVTMIDAAVHNGEDPLPISMLAHHANTDLVIKYTRSRGDVPLKMLGRLVEDLRTRWQPPSLGPSQQSNPVEDDQFSDDGMTDQVPLFFLKKSERTSSLFKQRFHVTSAELSDQLACRKFTLSQCDPVGPDLPDRSMLCKRCEARRPDLFA